MRVILDVFSGRKNPSWRLDEKNARELVERVKSFPPYSEALSARSQLGLRNVILELEPGESQGYALPAQVAFGVDDLPSLTSRVAVDSLKQQTATSIKRQTVEWLVNTPESILDDYTKNAISALMRRDERTVKPVKKDSDTQRSAAAFAQTTELGEKMTKDACLPFLSLMQFQFWNNPLAQPTNNCYNYASNALTYTLAQPGRFSGQLYTSFACAAVRDAAFADGVREDCDGPRRVIALAIWPGIDFHWWRMHLNGFWAHKVGWWPATNLDNRGRVIGNTLAPENCDRGPYSLFCGYYFAPLGMRVL